MIYSNPSESVNHTELVAMEVSNLFHQKKKKKLPKKKKKILPRNHFFSKPISNIDIRSNRSFFFHMTPSLEKKKISRNAKKKNGKNLFYFFKIETKKKKKKKLFILPHKVDRFERPIHSNIASLQHRRDL